MNLGARRERRNQRQIGRAKRKTIASRARSFRQQVTTHNHRRPSQQVGQVRRKTIARRARFSQPQAAMVSRRSDGRSNRPRHTLRLRQTAAWQRRWRPTTAPEEECNNRHDSRTACLTKCREWTSHKRENCNQMSK
jgi:hypothetical protein